MADVITTVGKNAVAQKIGGFGTNPDFNFLALGIGTAGAVVGDTTLGSEITTVALTRGAATVTMDSANVLQLVKVWTATGSKAITECGIFNASSVGTMLARSDFSAINVDSGDSIQITYKVTVS